MNILYYTKLDGTRASIGFDSLELLHAKLAKAKAANPSHDMQEVIFTEEEIQAEKARLDAEYKKLKPVTRSERMAARYMRRTSPVTAYAHGY